MDKIINRNEVVSADIKETNKWLSEQLGVNPSTVGKWCINSSQLDIGCLLKIANLLKVDIRELFVREYKQYLIEKEIKSICLSLN